MTNTIQEQRRNGRKRKMREQRLKKQRRYMKLFLLLQVIFICLALVLAANILSRLKRIERVVDIDAPMAEASQMEVIEAARQTDGKEELGNIPEYARACEVGRIERPIKRERAESLDKLKELEEEDERIASIIEKNSLYPEKLLEALANNPEMTNFVADYPNPKTTHEVSLTEEEKQMEYPLFLQWDPRWGYQNYGDDSNITLAGCGPTSLAMALYYLTRDESLTPGQIAGYAMENNYYMFGTGTLWSLMEDVPVHYGVQSQVLEMKEELMKQALDDGKILICSMRPGDFTIGGHFIVIYGYDDGFLINDPNCVERSRQVWSYEQLEYQMKQVWALSK